jgi:hypothetical protein
MGSVVTPVTSAFGLSASLGSNKSSGSASPVAATVSAPTTSEVSQASATDASGIKRRRRGRSQTILTGSTGVQEGATLGSPTLLG